MKKIVKFTAWFAALFAFSQAHAVNYVYITGAQSDRPNVQSAILHALGVSTSVTAPSTIAGTTIPNGKYAWAGTGATASTASYGIYTGFLGGTTSGTAVTIKTSFGGAVGGVYTVTNGINALFLPDSTTQTATGTGGAATPTTANGGVSAIPDITTSPVFQASTIYTSPTLTENIVGVIPELYVTNFGAPAGLTNITANIARALYGGGLGQVNLSLFTGSSSDQTVFILAVGRDQDAGIRLQAFAEAGLGTFAQTTQYQPTFNVSGLVSSLGAGQVQSDTQVNAVQYWQGPYTLYNGALTIQANNGGYNSASNLATLMRCATNATLVSYYNSNLVLNTSATGINLITYLGVSDAATVTAATVAGTTFGSGPGRTLSYNGVAYSVAAVQNGQYTLWGYEHLLYKSNLDGTTGPKYLTAQALINQLKGTNGGAGDSQVLLSSLIVNRSTDGSPVNFNNY